MILSALMLDEPRQEAVEERPAADVIRCALCNGEAPEESRYLVNARLSCAACVARVRGELARQSPTASGFLSGAGAGLIGALIGAVVWLTIGVVTNLEVGYVAVLVGFLAGVGVKMGAGLQRGQPLQALAAGLAVVGLLAAKYMIFVWMVVKLGHEHGQDISYFEPRLLSLFPQALGEMVGAFDVLFLFLALAAAYRVPKASAVTIARA